MSSFEAALIGRLLADSGVAALVGNRITWVQRPQETALPAITLQTITAPLGQTMDGIQETQQATVQVDCWATRHASGAALRDAVIAALIPAAEFDGVKFQRAFIPSRREGGEQGSNGFIYRQRIDFRLTFTA